jgi:NTE family protein
MPKTKIALACQGGGSQTAFTAGALKALCQAQGRLKDEFEFVAISGTSGGAVCATLLWYSFMKGERPVWKRMMDFWEENTAQGPVEHAINSFIVESVRLVNAGMMPTLQLSPSSPIMQSMMEFMTTGQRAGFSDFRGLLEKHIDFAEIASWGAKPQRPVLMLGAANVTSGALAKFVSAHESIRVEHILASCAVPNIFPAVQIGQDAYWDGLFSDNPPVEELLRPRSVGDTNIPDEIWLIKINPDRQPAGSGEAGRDRRPAQSARGQHLAVPAARAPRVHERPDPGRRVPAGVPEPLRHQGARPHSEVVPHGRRQALPHSLHRNAGRAPGHAGL